MQLPWYNSNELWGQTAKKHTILTFFLSRLFLAASRFWASLLNVCVTIIKRKTNENVIILGGSHVNKINFIYATFWSPAFSFDLSLESDATIAVDCPLSNCKGKSLNCHPQLTNSLRSTRKWNFLCMRRQYWET
jgi:hypothetical protein